MAVTNHIKLRLGEIRNRLSHVGKSEPLSIMSLILIGLLDVFVFLTIMAGIHEQVKQLTSPYELIPTICQDVVINNAWVEDNYISKISDYTLDNQYSAYYLEPQPQTHPICQPLVNGLASIQRNKQLIELFKERQKLDQKYNTYDLYQKQTFPEAKQIQVTIRNLDTRIAQHDEMKSLLSTIESSRTKADVLAESLRAANFTYPLKKFGMELMFLLPLFLLFYSWNAASISKDRPVQAFLSAHMLVVTFIPIMFRLGDLLLDILPRRFLEKFMELLKSINLIGIWYYIIIILAILSAMLLIYLIQKKWLTQHRLVIKRLSKGQCINCGIKIPLGTEHCPYCGVDQLITCNSCQGKTLKGGRFCTCCGEKLELAQ